MPAMRTTIYLPDGHLPALARYCKHKNISRAEAVRRAVADMLKSREALARAFGLWADRGGEGVAIQRRLRREWD